MAKTHSLTQGNILGTLIRFAVPVFFTLFLQALYGGVDLLVVGQFASTADVSGVATGSMLLSTVTMIITGLSMGITILVGETDRQPAPKRSRKGHWQRYLSFYCFRHPADSDHDRRRRFPGKCPSCPGGSL